MKENELIPYTIKDTGETVLIRRVSPLSLMAFARQFPEPQPPEQEVDYGDGVKRKEKNPSHPDYVRALQEHKVLLAEKGNNFVLRMGVVINLTEEQRARVNEIRDTFYQEAGLTLEMSDEMVWLQHAAIGTPDDLNELITAITQRSQPTEGAIAAHLSGFQGGLQKP